MCGSEIIKFRHSTVCKDDQSLLFVKAEHCLVEYNIIMLLMKSYFLTELVQVSVNIS